MTQNLPYPLAAIVQVAELSRALPDEIEERLRQLERAAARGLQDQMERWRDNDRAAQNSWARLAGMIGSVGARADPYRPSPMPQPDYRLESFLRFTRRIAAVRSSMKPLRFHMLIPPTPANVTQANAIAPEISRLIGRTMDNAQALETARKAVGDLRSLAVPDDWPDAGLWRRELAAEALDATELAARCAAALGRHQEATDLFARAWKDAVDQNDSARARTSRLNETREGVLAGHNVGDCLSELERDLWAIRFRSGPPQSLWLPQPPMDLNEMVVRAEINETLGDSAEARRLLNKAAQTLEPTPGQVVSPTREQFVTVMLEAVTLQKQDKPYVEALKRLRDLSEERVLALAFCNAAASAFRDTDPGRAKRYARKTIAIARM